MNKTALIGLSLILVLVLGLVGCGEAKSLFGLDPEPFVQSSKAEISVIGGDYSIVVSALIFNARPNHHGNVEVTADLWAQERHWQKSKVIYLHASEIVEIVFKEPTFLGSILGGDFKYRVEVRPY